jgi:Uma2 family endonuclease
MPMRWSEVLADKTLQDLPFKIETNEIGQLVMSPAKNIHAFFQGALARIFDKFGGHVLAECSVDTPKGVKVPDVAWCSDAFLAAHLREDPMTRAPEICAEVKSPSNSISALQDKVALYLNAGAVEVWLVSESGDVSFFDASGQVAHSRYVASVPNLAPKH